MYFPPLYWSLIFGDKCHEWEMPASGLYYNPLGGSTDSVVSSFEFLSHTDIYSELNEDASKLCVSI